MKKITHQELAEILFKRRDHITGLDIFANYNEQTRMKEDAYKVCSFRFAESPIVLINYYGGGDPFVYDIWADEDGKGLEAALGAYFERNGLSDMAWVDDNGPVFMGGRTFMPAGIHIGVDRIPVDGTMWWMRTPTPEERMAGNGRLPEFLKSDLEVKYGETR